MLVKSNLRKSLFGFIVSGYSPSRHFVATGRKHKEMNVGAQLFYVFRLGALLSEWCCPHLEGEGRENSTS